MTKTVPNTSINFKANPNFSDFKKDINSVQNAAATQNNTDSNTALPVSAQNVQVNSDEPEVQLQPQLQADVYEAMMHKKPSFLSRIKGNGFLKMIVASVASLLIVNFILNLLRGKGFGGANSLTKSNKELLNIWQDVSNTMALEDMALSGEGNKLVNELSAKVNFPEKIVEAGGGGGNAGILLHGPAGTGKTSIARAIAKHFPDSKFAVIDITNLGSEYQSVTERNLNKAFDAVCEAAKEDPKKKIFVFFDEIDTVMMEDKSSGSSHHSNMIMNEFKKGFVDKLGQFENIIPIGATNFEVDMEKAMANGKQLNKEMLDRFGSIYHIDLPTKEQFKSAISKNYQDASVSKALLSDEKLDIISEFMHNHKMSFRDLNVIQESAAIQAVNENNEKPATNLKHFFEGIKLRKEKFTLAPGETDKDAVLSELAQKLGISN